MRQAHPGSDVENRLPFRDRAEAGRRLAGRLGAYAGADALVMALPRGGVPVALEIASSLGAELDVFVVRKLGVPFQPELALGAIASGGTRVLNEDLVRTLGLSVEEINRIAAAEAEELRRRETAYRGNRPFPRIVGRIVILVDDGAATGATMRAAAQALRLHAPSRLVVAVPVAPSDVVRGLAGRADEVVTLASPDPFLAVGTWYESFPQLTDGEVRELLVGTGAVDRP